MEPKSSWFADHTREELRKLAPTALLMIPLGATEQHGPHLPVGTDFYVIEHLAREAAKLASSDIPLVVAPALPFGSSQHHLPFGGTFSFGTEAYYRVLCELLRSAVRSGFERIFLLNGHGGNHELAQLAARDMALSHPVQIAAASYWTLAWDALIACNAHKGGRFPGHAGRFETSLVMALRPELVKEDRPVRTGLADGSSKSPYASARFERHGSWQAIDGYSDSPAHGSVKLGEEYLPVIIDAIAQALISFYASTGSSSAK